MRGYHAGTPELTLDDFIGDAPWETPHEAPDFEIDNLIDGVRIQPLVNARYKAGSPYELLTLRPMHGRETAPEAIPHVYRVYAPPGAERGWIYHKRQHDRLTFTEGHFRFVLYDIRSDSPTCGVINELDLGAERPAMLTIPPFVVHGVKNQEHGRHGGQLRQHAHHRLRSSLAGQVPCPPGRYAYPVSV